MFKVELENRGTMGFTFEYGTFPDQVVTTCLVYVNPDERPVAVSLGEAKCQTKFDNFSRVVGRKLALTRALKDGHFSRDERTKFWNVYKERCKLK